MQKAINMPAKVIAYFLNAIVVIIGIGLVLAAYGHIQSLKRNDLPARLSEQFLTVCPDGPLSCQTKTIPCRTVGNTTECKTTITVGQRGI